MATVIAAIIALGKILPIVDRWLVALCLAVTQNTIKKMKEEDINAPIQATKSNDQRALEKLLGSPRAGQASGISGSGVVDSLPGVPD